MVDGLQNWPPPMPSLCFHLLFSPFESGRYLGEGKKRKMEISFKFTSAERNGPHTTLAFPSLHHFLCSLKFRSGDPSCPGGSVHESHQRASSLLSTPTEVLGRRWKGGALRARPEPPGGPVPAQQAPHGRPAAARSSHL